MNVKHTLNFAGTPVEVLGPADVEDVYKAFLDEVAQKMGMNPIEKARFRYVLQLTPIGVLHNHVWAYQALGILYEFLNQHNSTTYIIKCDTFFSPPSFVKLSPPKLVASQENTPLDKLTEILVSKRKSLLGGTTSGSLRLTIQGQLQKLIPWLMPQPQTIIFLLVMTTVFGFLGLPLK